MAQTTAKKGARVPAPRAKPTGKKAAVAPAVARTTELSEDVLKSVESGQRAALEAVRTFVDRVDDALPGTGATARRRETVIDAALELADRLITTQYEFLRSVVHDAGHAVTKATKKK
jgi:hypothetical protein